MSFSQSNKVTVQSEESENENIQTISSYEGYTITQEAIEILRLAFFSVGTNVLSSLMSVVDLLMVGHLGTDELAAASIASTYFLVFYSFIIGVSFAFEAVGSQVYGSRDFVSLNHIFRQGFVVCSVYLFVISICLSLIGFFARYVLFLDDNISDMAAQFEWLLIPGLWSFAFYQIMTKYLQVQNHMIAPLLINLVGNVFNGGMSYVLIYVFDFGIIGAPLATTLSRTFMCISLLFCILWIQSDPTYSNGEKDQENEERKGLINKSKEEEIEMKRERLFILSKEHWIKAFNDIDSMKSLFKQTFSGGVTSCFEIISFQITIFEASVISTTDVDAQQICITLDAFTFVSFPLGLSIAGSIRVGNLLGENRPEQAKMSGNILNVLGIFVMCLLATFYLTTRNYLGMIFTSDDEVIDHVSKLLIVISIYQVLDGLHVTNNAILRGTAQLELTAKIDFISYWLIAIPIGSLLTFVFDWGTSGLWWGFVFGLGCADILLLFMVYRIDWKSEAEKAGQRAKVVESRIKLLGEDEEKNCNVEEKEEEKEEEIITEIIKDKETEIDEERQVSESSPFIEK